MVLNPQASKSRLALISTPLAVIRSRPIAAAAGREKCSGCHERRIRWLVFGRRCSCASRVCPLPTVLDLCASRKTPDARWELLRSFLTLAVDLQPEIVTMENVRGLAAKPIWQEFAGELKDVGYHVAWGEVLCSDFGVPQSRKRLVLIASRKGAVEVPAVQEGTSPRTVRDAIGKLPPLEAGEAHADDPLHVACRLSPTNLRRIRASKPGGTWRDLA